MENRYEAISSISSQMQDEKPKQERLNSKEVVLNAISNDFFWFNSEDLERVGIAGNILNVTANNEGNSDSYVTSRRIVNVYQGKDVDTRDGLNEYERMYVQARSYARLCELSVALGFVKDNDEIAPASNNIRVKEALTRMSYEQRKLLAMETLANIEGSLKDLLTPKWELEKKLFGHTINDPAAKYFVEFASGKTFGPDFEDAAGLYTNAALELLASMETWGNDVYTEPDRYKAYIEILAEITSHEYGHTGINETDRLYWQYEEAWNEWKSVTLPRDLAGDHYKKYNTLRHGKTYHAQPTLVWKDNETHYIPHLYHASVITNENNKMELAASGGSEAIAAMVEEMSRGLEAFGGKNEIDVFGVKCTFDRDFVLKCALATAYTRRESGTITFEGQRLLCFGSLYNQYAQHRRDLLGEATFETYADKMSGSSDYDYQKYTDQLKKVK